MVESDGLSWEAKKILQKIKSFNRLPGSGIPLKSIEYESWQREDR